MTMLLRGTRQTLLLSARRRTLLLDLFAGTDGTALTAHTMNVGPGWTANAGVAVITGGSAHFTTDLAGSLGPMTTTAGAADGTVRVSVNISMTISVAGILLRFADTANWWLLRMGGTADVLPGLSIHYSIAGVATQAAYTPGTIPVGPHTLSISMRGPNLSGTVDGGLPVNYAGATLNQTVKNHGIYSEKATNTFSRFQQVV